MTQETQDKLISTGGLVLLCALGVWAHSIGAELLAATLVAGALGHAMPGRAQRVPVMGALSVPPPAPEAVITRSERRGREGYATFEALGVVCFGGLALVAILLANACGATPQQRAAYAVEQARCISNERAIIAREGSTREADIEAMELERERCDAALRAIEGGQ